MNLKTRVAFRIKTFREHSGLTKEQLAKKAHRTDDPISNNQRADSHPRFETLERLAAALGVPVREFFDFGDAEEPPHRTQSLAKLAAVARSLTDDDLEVAVRQIEALAERNKPQHGGKASK
jgi:transcriptional regulator with XRE-family HTH domain